MKNPVQTFHIHEEIQFSDLQVLKKSMIRFLETEPALVVLDLSEADLSVSETELNHVLSEIKTVAQTENCTLVIAQTDIESIRAPVWVQEIALQKKIQILQGKIELREEVLKNTDRLKEQNTQLRDQIGTKKNPLSFGLSPLVEKLWSANEIKNSRDRR